jgi:hypothetical protein
MNIRNNLANLFFRDAIRQQVRAALATETDATFALGARPACTLSYIDGAAWLRFGDGLNLHAGEQARLTYAARHTLAGLDGAETASVPEAHEGVLALGAAVFAALQRIHRLAGSIGASPAEPERLRELAEKYLERFNLELFSLRSVQPVQGFPAGFNLDEWD